MFKANSIIIIIIIIITNWILSDSKTPQVFRTLLIILGDFRSAIVGMILILPLIRSSSIFFRFLDIVPRAPTMNDITVTFNSLAKWKYFSSFSPSFTTDM